jgi:alkylation response protein AidB-like acyl-CoA dehydrogenase
MSAALDLVAMAEAQMEDLAARGRAIEEARRVPAEVVARLSDAGFFRMLVPSAYGGGEVTPSVFIRALAALGSGDAAVGWCAMVGSTAGLLSAYIDPAAAQGLWGADPRLVAAGVFAPTATGKRVPGGWEITGRWSFASGCEHAGVRAGGFVGTTDDGKPVMRQALFDASATRLHDTWDVMGLGGTGSHDISVEATFVPDARVADLDASPTVKTPLTRFPVFGLLAIGVAGVAVGVGQAAVRDLVSLANGKKAMHGSRPISHRETVQLDVGRAQASLEAALAGLCAAADDVYARTTRGDAVRLEDKLRLRRAATFATHTSADVVTAMHKAAGGTSVYNKCPLGRHLRNVHVATQHIMVHEQTYVVAGRGAFGLEVMDKGV